MPDKVCCTDCFGDLGLSTSIFPTLIDVATPRESRRCDYCRSEGSNWVAPAALGQWFEMLVDVYAADPDGRPLVEWLREDWGLFSNQAMDDAHAKELIADVLNDGEIVRGLFSPSKVYDSESLKRWSDLRDEMMHRNRWFLDEPIDLDRRKHCSTY